MGGMGKANRWVAMGFSGVLRGAAALAAVLVLAGCETFGIGASATPPAPAGRPLDVNTDDLAKLVFAFDLPPNVQPVQGEMQASLDVATPSMGKRHVMAPLVLGDGDGVDGALPPLAVGHTYYLMGFSPRGQAALAAAREWQASLPSGAAPVSTFTMTPKLCALGPVNPTETATVRIALPNGPPLLPLLGPAPPADLNGGKPLPACRG
jgi:hypothetical protein